MAKRRAGMVSWAQRCARPVGIPVGRPRGRKRAGCNYEKELACALPEAEHGVWWEFRDQFGRAVCQTDLVLDLPLRGMVVVLEAKYTWTPAGQEELSGLYLPVLSKALGKPVLGVVVCRALTTTTPKAAICSDLDSAIDRAARGLPAVLHWFSGPLRTRRQAATSVPLVHLTPLA